jgi:transposase
MKIRSNGIDLGKTTFHLVALGERGKPVIKKKFSRKQLLAFTANLPAALIGLEACSGSHFPAKGRPPCATLLKGGSKPFH